MLFSLGIGFSFAQTTYVAEHFDYPNGDSLTNHGWYAHSAAEINPVLVGAPGLSWLGYIGSGVGNAAIINNTGQDVNKPFSANINAGSVYASFLMKVDLPFAEAGEGFFFHFGTYTDNQTPNADFSNISTAFRARTFVLQGTDPNTQFKLGLAFNNATTPSGQSQDLEIGETYLVVVKYTFVPGDLNDAVSLFAFASSSDISEEPASPDLGPFTFTGNMVADAPALQAVVLRQYDEIPNITIDGMIVKDVWDIEACIPTTGTDTKTACTSYTWIDGNTYDESNNTATFNIVGGAANGCDSLVTLNLTIVNVEAGVTLAGTTLTAVATNASYQWLDCDNNNAEINGEADASFSPDATGNYAVEVTQNGCTAISECNLVTIVGIEEDKYSDFSVYPNPNRGAFTLSWTEAQSKSIRILNALGQEIWTAHTYGTHIDLNLSILSGVYLVEVSDDNNQVNRQRIIIE